MLTQANNTTKLPACRWASFYLVVGLIKTLGPLTVKLTILPRQLWLVLAVYLTGLITQENVTVTAMAAAVGVVSHDRLSRLLQELTWGLGQGAILAVRLLEALGLEGYLILDDVLIAKPFASQIALCFWDHDHSLKRHTFGQRLVFVVWSNGWLTIPLLFAFWQKGPKPPGRKRRRKPGRPRKRGRKVTTYSTKAKRRRARYKLSKRGRQRRVRLANGVHLRSKNELARCLVWRLMRRGLQVQFILFDNWYASADNLRLFERLGLYWVTRSKENAKVELEQQQLSVKAVGASVKKANYHYYGRLGLRARSFAVNLAGRSVKLTVLKDDTAPEAGRTKYLLTNALTLTVQQHVQWYRRRWAIEVFFRDAKQFLGLTKCEARTERAVISHVGLVCVAYVFLQLLKPVATQTRPSTCASKHTLAHLVVVVLGPAQRQIAQPKPTGEMKVISLEHLWHPVRTRLPNAALPELLDFT